MVLAEHFIAHFNERLRKRVRGLEPEVIEVFRRYRWPGNVRELRNVIERAMILEDTDLITTAYLPCGLSPEERGAGGAREAGGSGELPRVIRLPAEGVRLDEVEKELVEQAVARSGGNRTRAARLLGISRDRLRYRLKKLSGGAAKMPLVLPGPEGSQAGGRARSASPWRG
jgi:DNA-binding NtrC family response regulator